MAISEEYVVSDSGWDLYDAIKDGNCREQPGGSGGTIGGGFGNQGENHVAGK